MKILFLRTVSSFSLANLTFLNSFKQRISKILMKKKYIPYYNIISKGLKLYNFSIGDICSFNLEFIKKECEVWKTLKAFKSFYFKFHEL